jgi:hypothetical protein
MSYQHCPSCRLTVHLEDDVLRDGPCPRCGERLADEPGRLFGGGAPTGRLAPEVVQALLQSSGGRFSRRRATHGGTPGPR